MAIAVVVVVFHEEVLVSAVAGERNGSDTEARENVLESVDAAEWTGVPPRLTAEQSAHILRTNFIEIRTIEPKGLSWPKPTAGWRRP
jgi:hypothetical protein